MTRPQMIRADTIDLQDPDSPSAKDHSRQPTNPAPLGDGPPAPHQAIALKNAGLDGLEHPTRSPRASQDLSGKELQLLHDIDGHAGLDGHTLASQVHGVDAGEDGEVGDQEGDDSLDDDMMDKISSSPSIDSGGYPLPWLHENTSLLSTPPPFKNSGYYESLSDELSSSPFLKTPEYFPIFLSQPHPDTSFSEDRRYQGEYLEPGSSGIPREDSYSSEARDQLGPLISEARLEHFREDDGDATFGQDDLHLLLLPADDPLLDNCFEGEDSRVADSITITPASLDSDESDSDEIDEISYSDSRFVDSGWGGECLREIEDISFEFVYALHTFIATVEGQANATKGDTMVLLDDSNSYWWLVKVVKDSSIGYLPAEHIETPTERLARLNKHRNIDLSQTMLGDNQEKPRNPLKIAMRRRNAKTVTFTAPIYYEPSDNDYSSDEDSEDGDFPQMQDAGGLALDHQDKHATEGKVAAVEPLNIRGSQSEPTSRDEIQAAVPSESDEVEDSQVSKSRSSEDIGSDDGALGKSRKGSVRNTDSFFNNDTGETRKITITPGLLRDDTSTSITTITSDNNPNNNNNKEPKLRPSLDALDKAASSAEKSKDGKDEKRKDKKPGMLSGLFKRKDRKSKTQSQSEDEDPEWLQKEIARQSQASQSKISSESAAQESRSEQISPGSRSPQRQTSKLQKSQPIKVSTSSKRSPSREGPLSPIKSPVTEQPAPTRPAPEVASLNTFSQSQETPENGSYNRERSESTASNPFADQGSEPDQLSEYPPSSPVESRSRGGTFSSMREPLRPSPSAEAKPEKTIKVKERMPMDEFDSSPEVEEAPPVAQQTLQRPESPVQPKPLRRPEEAAPRNPSLKDRLSESPIQVSPVHPSHQTPPAGDSSSQEEPSMSMSTSSTPELVEVPHEENLREEEATPTSTIQSTRSAPAWSDSSLRTYLENDTDIRDLLIVVHDKSDLKPAGPDHRVVQNLCKEEHRRLGDMSNRLDNLLQDLLTRNAKAPVR